MYRHLETFAIGGLLNIGYSEDNLIVLSSQGRGIFDCLTGSKTYRDSLEWWNDFDTNDNVIKGFSLEEGKLIKMYGIHNPQSFNTENGLGWKLETSGPEPDDAPFERFLIHKLFLLNNKTGEKIYVAKDGPCELRTFGFSPTGNSFVFATNCELVIWVKE